MATSAAGGIWSFGGLRAQEPSLTDVMRRVHGHVVLYEDDLSAVIAEEHYEQQVLDHDGTVQQERTLVSDYWVFQLPPEEMWFAVRDVRTVDGAPVRNRQESLRDLFSGSPGQDAIERAMAIADASARYNIGDAVRTFNVPTFVLAFLRPGNRERVRFVKLGDERLDGLLTWVIGYQEVKGDGPTFITTPDGLDLLTRGRLWVDPGSGQLIRTELITGDARIGRTARITVRYRTDPGVSLWVPGQMDEEYERTDGQTRLGAIVGTATYSNYRAFAPE